jgi:hypothetical protein
MRFLLSVPPFTDPAVVVGWARDAEAHGWDGFFLWDHLSWNGKVEVHDPWVLLGAIAAETSRIRIGTLVTPISRRRPQVLAKHLTTLDHLSGGRVTVGIGLGDPPDLDFSDFGDEASYKTRAAITDEALTVVAGLLGEGRVSHHGEHLDVDASVRPLPVQRPRIPIWVAGRAPHGRPLARDRQPIPVPRRPRGVRRPTPARRLGPRRPVDAGLRRGRVRGGGRDLAGPLGLAAGGRLARRGERHGRRRARRSARLTGRRPGPPWRERSAVAPNSLQAGHLRSDHHGEMPCP